MKTLVVASAYPDPPFDVMTHGMPGGFDVELTRAICRRLGYGLRPVPYEGADFNGIFDGLQNGTYDAVISGTTITPARAKIVLFSKPYLEFNQGIAVNRVRTPRAETIGNLHGLVAGIQSGNTSDIVARHLLAVKSIGGIRYYPYNGIETMLGDLQAGRIGLIVKLFPVISWLIKNRPDLAVTMQVPTHEKLGIAYAKNNTGLRDEVDAAIELLREDGEFARIESRYFPESGSSAKKR
jgi:polar amino acid transport system substrate-binding protein